MATEATYRPAKVGTGADRPSTVGFMRAMIGNPVSAIPAAAYAEPFAAISMLGSDIVFVSDPDMLEEILIRRVADFPKSHVDERILQPAFGNSLLTAHGEDWRWKRRLAAPYFAPAALARFVPDMVVPFRELAGSWRNGGAAETRDVLPDVTTATLEVICRALFSGRDELAFEEISDAINEYLAPISWVIWLASMKVPSWVPHPGYRHIRRAVRRMRSVVANLIDGRRKSGSDRGDICDDLMRAKDPETGRPLSDDDLVDMLLTLVAAGHETSANALTWALHCLAEQPDVQEELAAEIDGAVGQKMVTAADLPALVKAEAFLRETMRLFPPVPLMARRTIKPDRLGSLSLKTGTLLFIPVYAIHRHARLWKDPDRFDIARFTGPDAKSIGRTAYLPFGAGPRICVGATFAMMEMVAALATLVQNVRFAPADGFDCHPIHRITLRPQGGMPLRVAPRATD